MIFPFKKTPYPAATRTIRRPIIPVKVTGPKANLIIEALIDSGADMSLFDIEIAKAVGVDLRKVSKQQFGGIGKDTVTVYLTKIAVEVIGTNHSVTIPVGFMKGANVRGLLGQEGFFDNFKIIFNRANDSIEITPSRIRVGS